MTVLLNRNAFAIFYQPPAGTGPNSAAQQKTPLNATKLTTRIKFTVEKFSQSSYLMSGKSTVDLYNLSKSTRNALKQPNTFMRIDAGYGTDTQILMNQRILSAKENQTGPDVITTVECMDGGIDLTFLHADFTLSQGGTNRQAFAYIQSVLNQAGVSNGFILDLPMVQYAGRGRTFSGPVGALLDLIIHQAGFVWSIQDGQLTVYDPTLGTAPTTYVLSEKTGLIGVPNKDMILSNSQDPNITANSSFYTFKSLLNPRLVPGAPVKVISQYVPNGLYTPYKVSHTGDNWEGDYFTTLECNGGD